MEKVKKGVSAIADDRKKIINVVGVFWGGRSDIEDTSWFTRICPEWNAIYY